MKEIARNNRIARKHQEFMEGQREKARAKSAFGGSTSTVSWRTRPESAESLATADDFRGYEQTRLQTHVIELLGEEGETRRAVDR